ncbi:ABC transporter ATP-binding protein [Spirulina subsalsa FACHB-351]|uniref:ABC transporter ATP-binding protein n=1 Tax=Spirulina subsalsa FACHB-351 TaxID=234711 RepID=A0ABT3KZW3_9CYAN|nr:ABC transporter ATP-binding protein [Spirulina subsalsa]MCW6034792.1 ABC transporter ATP-binding protein [Spirulina subsalsa FACHB-351]
MIAQSPIILTLENVSKTYAPGTLPAVNQVSLQLQEGDLLGLLGPSGCGKTTLLRLIAGFEEPDQGWVEIGGTVVAGQGEWLPPEKRGVGMVFQDYALFPHLTVADNIAFGLRQGKQMSRSVGRRVGEVLHLVGLEGLAQRYPYQLSGGQQQRVALARALAPRPALVLLDEPLSNLDVQVRLRLRQELRMILKAAHTAAVFVTHDQEEALSISDWVGVMQQGHLEQLGTPEGVYLEPSSRFVAEFVTQANFLPAQRGPGGWETELGVFELPETREESGEIMVRQEDLILQPDEGGNGVICDRQFLGREHCYSLKTTTGQQLMARATQQKPLDIGTKVQISVIPQSLRLFPQDLPNRAAS